MLLRSDAYPASLKINYSDKLDRLSTFFRIFLLIPILILLFIISGSGVGTNGYSNQPIEVSTSESINTASTDIKNNLQTGGLGIAGGLFVATAVMILFRRRYPRWWFDFNLEFNRFTTRIFAYALLLTDQYPSTVDEQAVKLELKYPDVEKDLNRWLPLIKWFLAIPHYVVLFFLAIGVVFAVIVAWFAILLTGRYPRGLFDFVAGFLRWSLRVNAYAFLLTTDKYPPFSLD